MGKYKHKDYVKINNDGDSNSRNRMTTKNAAELVRQLWCGCIAICAWPSA